MTSTMQNLRALFVELKKVLPKPDGNAPHFENMSQMSVMTYLIDHIDEDISQKDIEVNTHRSKATVSGILDTLERRNMIHRVPSTIDHRKKIIVVSEDVRLHIKGVKQQFNDVEQLLLDGVTKEDMEAFDRVISQMLVNIQRR